MSDKTPHYLSVDKLFANAEKSTIFEEVEEKLRAESANKLSCEAYAREMENWSRVASKVVGHEGDLF